MLDGSASGIIETEESNMLGTLAPTTLIAAPVSMMTCSPGTSIADGGNPAMSMIANAGERRAGTSVSIVAAWGVSKVDDRERGEIGGTYTLRSGFPEGK